MLSQVGRQNDTFQVDLERGQIWPRWYAIDAFLSRVERVPFDDACVCKYCRLLLADTWPAIEAISRYTAAHTEV